MTTPLYSRKPCGSIVQVERTVIFADDQDRENFIERLPGLFSHSQTPCYAWAIMSNHAHLLLRTGNLAVASIVRRLLTGYPMSKEDSG